MFRFVVLLLGARLRLMYNTFRRGTIWARIGWVAAGLGLIVGGGLSGLLGYGLARLPDFFGQPEVQEALQGFDLPLAALQPEAFLAMLLGLLVLAIWGLLLLGGLGAALNNFYLSSDLDLLVAAPIPMRAIFAAKFLEGLGLGYLLLFALGGAALVGLGQGSGYAWPYYLGAVLVLLLLPLVPQSLGTLLVMPLVRIISPKRLREALQILGALVGASFYLFSQLSSNAEIDPQQAGQLMRWIYQLRLSYLPQNWAVQGLLSLGAGRHIEAVVSLAAFGLLSLGLLGLSLVAAERLYYSGWAQLQAAPAGRRRRSPRGARVDQGAGRPRGLLALLPGPLRGLVAKDLRLWLRDPQGWTEMVMPLAVYALFLVQGLRRMGIPEVGQEAATLTMSLFVLFLSSAMISRLSIGGIGSEGQQVWLLKVTPIPPRRILWAKVLAAYLPYVALSGLMLLGLALVNRTGWTLFLGTWLLLALLGLGMIAVGVGLGASFPRFDVEKKRQHVAPGAGCLYFPLVMVYALVTAGLILLPLLLGNLLYRIGLPGAVPILWVIGPGGAVVLSVLAILVPLKIGAERLARLEV